MPDPNDRNQNNSEGDEFKDAIPPIPPLPNSADDAQVPSDVNAPDGAVRLDMPPLPAQMPINGSILEISPGVEDSATNAERESGIITPLEYARAETKVDDRFRIGTLHYTVKGLIVLFVWLLWGDFCFQLMETVIPGVFPLYMLKKLHVDNKTAALMKDQIPYIFGLVLGPIISFRSDRFRSRWGRRIPFIIWTTPIVVLGLVGLAFTHDIFNYMQTATPPFHMTAKAVAVLYAAIFIVIFAIGNEFVNSVFWYLFADTVPKAFLGRFLSLFRMMSSLSLMFFARYIKPHTLDENPPGIRWIFIGAAALYAIGFTLMCVMVKEGEYPPPEPIPNSGAAGIAGWFQKVAESCKVYVTECFSHRIYIGLFLHTLVSSLAGVASIGMGVFTLDALHIDLKTSGDWESQFIFISLLLQYPAGWLADKFGAMRVLIYLQILVAPIQFSCFLFQTNLNSWIAFHGINTVVGAVLAAAAAPLLINMFPKDKYGQFASCNGVMKSIAKVIGPTFGAGFIDYMTSNGKVVDNYRYTYIWIGVFQVLAYVILLWVYRVWKARGGDQGYIAPNSALEKELLAEKGALAAGAIR